MSSQVILNPEMARMTNSNVLYMCEYVRVNKFANKVLHLENQECAVDCGWSLILLTIILTFDMTSSMI